MTGGVQHCHLFTGLVSFCFILLPFTESRCLLCNDRCIKNGIYSVRQEQNNSAPDRQKHCKKQKDIFYCAQLVWPRALTPLSIIIWSSLRLEWTFSSIKFLQDSVGLETARKADCTFIVDGWIWRPKRFLYIYVIVDIIVPFPSVVLMVYGRCPYI